MTKFVGTWKRFPEQKPPKHNPIRDNIYDPKVYLVSHKGGWVELAEWFSPYEAFYRFEGNKNYPITDQVIAWMELPPPFTAEKEK